MGKTTLLRDAAAHAQGLRVLRARGIESESELPFAALSELLSPLLDLRSEIPPVQSQALGGALALEAAPVTDRFAVAAGVLSLLGAAAERQPVLAVVDDVQWIDEASREALLFAAHRLDAEGVVLLFGLRDGEGVEAGDLGLDAMHLDGLDEASARQLLATEGPRARGRRAARGHLGGQPARAAGDPARADRRPARRPRPRARPAAPRRDARARVPPPRRRAAGADPGRAARHRLRRDHARRRDRGRARQRRAAARRARARRGRGAAAAARARGRVRPSARARRRLPRRHARPAPRRPPRAGRRLPRPQRRARLAPRRHLLDA